ncbi:MAG: high-potential iron-sulfur protein [Burkholderiales bacterium]
MKNEITSTRRQFIKLGGAALAAIPLLALTSKAGAATNAQMRTIMKYQNTPNAGRSCSGCAQFIPGKTPTALGGCKVFPGDTEITPTGFCLAFAAKPK